MSKQKPKSDRAALARIGERLDELSPERRREIQIALAKIERQAAYSGSRRGPKPKLGTTMTEVCVVKCSSALKDEFKAQAKKLGFENVGDYFRHLHREHVEREERRAK